VRNAIIYASIFAVEQVLKRVLMEQFVVVYQNNLPYNCRNIHQLSPTYIFPDFTLIPRPHINYLILPGFPAKWQTSQFTSGDQDVIHLVSPSMMLVITSNSTSRWNNWPTRFIQAEPERTTSPYYTPNAAPISRTNNSAQHISK